MDEIIATELKLEGSSKVGPAAFFIAILSVIVASSVTFYSIFLHLMNYRRPDLQRSALRIILMVPIYGIANIIRFYLLNLSLSSRYWSYYIDTVRDIYEAFVIYSFFTMLINYLDGERSILVNFEGRLSTHHIWPLRLFWKPLDMSDPETFLFIRKGVLQFIIVKPVMDFLIIRSSL